MKRLILLFVLICNIGVFSQNISIKSNDSKIGIEGVLILNKNGEIVGKTDINGIANFDLLQDDYYELHHPNIESEKIDPKTIQNNQILVSFIREKNIEEVKIEFQNKDDIILEGYFNSYVTNNGKFNIYIDGIIQYVFDKKTKKYKQKIIKEYRSFILEKKENSREIANIVFDRMVQIPDLSKITELNNENTKYKKIINLENNEVLHNTL